MYTSATYTLVCVPFYRNRFASLPRRKKECLQAQNRIIAVEYHPSSLGIVQKILIHLFFQCYQLELYSFFIIRSTTGTAVSNKVYNLKYAYRPYHHQFNRSADTRGGKRPNNFRQLSSLLLVSNLRQGIAHANTYPDSVERDLLGL